MSCKTTLRKFSLVLALGAAALMAMPHTFAQQDVKSFNLFPNPKVVGCLGVAGGPTPQARVTIYRGKQNDTLQIDAENIRPGLAFDMFTVRRTNRCPTTPSIRLSPAASVWRGINPTSKPTAQARFTPASRPFCWTRFSASIRNSAILRPSTRFTPASGSTIRKMPTSMAAPLT